MKDEIALKKAFSTEEFERFLSIQSTETNIFNGWIEQNKSLKNLLLHLVVKEHFKDAYRWREHALFENFKRYVGPFFLVILQKKSLSDISGDWATIFSYFELIDDENRLFLEQSLYLGIRNKIDQSLSICNNKSITETDFQQQLLFLLSDACIAIHNSLSRSSHSLKIEFTENTLQLFYHPKCTAKSAHWMILQLEKINLNEEQKKSLQTIKQKIKLGEIQFSHQPQKDKKSIVKNVSLLVLGLALIGIIYFLVNQNFEVTTQNYRDASSLASFSIKERKEIDSLIRSMKENENDSVTIDENYFGSSIILRKPFENILAEKIYRDLEQDMSNHFGGVYDTTISISESKLSDELISKTTSLKALKGKNELEWKNVSEYTLILFAWNEDSNSPVYSGIIAPKKTLKFSSIKNMRIMAVPGIGYGKIPTKNGKEFQILKNHFCAIDFNFEYATQQVFTLSKNAVKTNKILIEGKLGEVVGISDSQGVLDIE